MGEWPYSSSTPDTSVETAGVPACAAVALVAERKGVRYMCDWCGSGDEIIRVWLEIRRPMPKRGATIDICLSCTKKKRMKRILDHVEPGGRPYQPVVTAAEVEAAAERDSR